MINELIEYRGARVDGKAGWWWPKEDRGAWNGPGHDFPPLRDIVINRVRKLDLIVQAGGCCGMYPSLWARHFGMVVTAEPDSLNFLCLSLNCQSENIVKLNAAFGEGGMVTLQKSSQVNVGEHKISTRDPREMVAGHRVPSLRIDDLGLHVCDAIQLDVEGYEAHVLRGATQTIARFRPVIVVETLDEHVQAVLDAHRYELAARTNADKVFVPT